MSPKIVDREERHREILTAAFDLFVEKGYHKTTLGDIAKAVGIGQGTLYYYFPAKDEIFWGVYDLMMSHIEENVTQRLESLTDPQERLEEFLKVLFLTFPEVGLFDTDADGAEGPEWQMAAVGFSHVLMEFWLQAERTGKREQFYERIAQHQKAIIHGIQQLFAEMAVPMPQGLDHELLAHLLMALHDGISIQLRMGVLPKDRRILQRIVQVFLQQFRDAAQQATPPTSDKPMNPGES